LKETCVQENQKKKADASIETMLQNEEKQNEEKGESDGKNCVLEETDREKRIESFHWEK
jgi:hypothetical protein